MFCTFFCFLRKNLKILVWNVSNVCFVPSFVFSDKWHFEKNSRRRNRHVPRNSYCDFTMAQCSTLWHCTVDCLLPNETSTNAVPSSFTVQRLTTGKIQCTKGCISFSQGAVPSLISGWGRSWPRQEEGDFNFVNLC